MLLFVCGWLIFFLIFLLLLFVCGWLNFFFFGCCLFVVGIFCYCLFVVGIFCCCLFVVGIFCCCLFVVGIFCCCLFVVVMFGCCLFVSFLLLFCCCCRCCFVCFVFVLLLTNCFTFHVSLQSLLFVVTAVTVLLSMLGILPGFLFNPWIVDCCNHLWRFSTQEYLAPFQFAQVIASIGQCCCFLPTQTEMPMASHPS